MKNESISTKKIVMTAFFAAIIYLESSLSVFRFRRLSEHHFCISDTFS